MQHSHRHASRTIPAAALIATALTFSAGANQEKKYVDCPHIIIRKSPSRLLSGRSTRTARSIVASFPFL
jgi:hypothetical protein